MISGLGLVEKLNANRLGGVGTTVAPPTSPAASAASFADALEAAASQSVTTLKDAEALSLRALQGEVHTREVVDAVMSAEQTLQAAIAIRDKIVTAYLEVSRMAI